MENTQDQLSGYSEFANTPTGSVDWHNPLGFAHLAHVEQESPDVNQRAGRQLHSATFPRGRCLNEDQLLGWDSADEK